jgi:opacity protein-like surface antigen
MLRRILLASAGAMALTGAALAADLPSPGPPPVFLPPPPVYTWTGLYVGINAGYTWSNSDSVATSAINTQFCGGFCSGGGLASAVASAASATGATATLPAKFEGFIGGGQIGYNYQFYNSWLVGLEADIQGVAGNNNGATLVSVTTLTGIPLPDHSIGTTLSVSRRLDYLGTVRERLGFLLTPTLLVYGTGGLAYGGVNSSTSINQVFNGPVPSSIATAWALPRTFPLRASVGLPAAAANGCSRPIGASRSNICITTSATFPMALALWLMASASLLLLSLRPSRSSPTPHDPRLVSTAMSSAPA